MVICELFMNNSFAVSILSTSVKCQCRSQHMYRIELKTGWVQERRNYIADTLELRLSCSNPSGCNLDKNISKGSAPFTWWNSIQQAKWNRKIQCNIVDSNTNGNNTTDHKTVDNWLWWWCSQILHPALCLCSHIHPHTTNRREIYCNSYWLLVFVFCKSSLTWMTPTPSSFFKCFTWLLQKIDFILTSFVNIGTW